MSVETEPQQLESIKSYPHEAKKIVPKEVDFDISKINKEKLQEIRTKFDKIAKENNIQIIFPNKILNYNEIIEDFSFNDFEKHQISKDTAQRYIKSIVTFLNSVQVIDQFKNNDKARHDFLINQIYNKYGNPYYSIMKRSMLSANRINLAYAPIKDLTEKIPDMFDRTSIDEIKSLSADELSSLDGENRINFVNNIKRLSIIILMEITKAEQQSSHLSKAA